MKITNGHYICDFLHEQGFQVIQVIRHPLHQSVSCERNQWSDHLDDFLMCKDALEDSLTMPEFDCLMRVNKSGTAFEKLALTWILENLPFLRVESNRH